jgi:hypothetical protein
MSKKSVSKQAVQLGTMVVTSAIALGLGAAAAGASTTAPASLPNVQAKAAAAITLRINDLNAAISKVNGAKNLGAEASTLDAYLRVDIAPLQSLGQQIAADTTVQSALAAASTIFTNYRVLALVLPASRIAGDAARLDNGAIPTLTADVAKVTAKVTPGNQAELEPLIDNVNADIGSATTSASGVASTVLSDTPSEWNANHSLLTTARGQISSAASDVANALRDLQQIRADLKNGRAGAAATPTTAS